MKSEFALRLKSLRQKKNVTQEQLCRELSVDVRLYYHYEKPNGNTMPPYITAINLSRYFNVSIEYLLGLNEKSVLSKSQLPPRDNVALKLLFAPRLSNLRKENGLTQSHVAQAINVSLRRYQAYEFASDTSMPSYKTLLLICKEFNCSIDYMLGNSDNPIPCL